MVCQHHLHAATVGSAAAVSDAIVSDHAAVAVTITPRAARPPAERPLAKHLFHDQCYLGRLRAMVDCADWG
eukprot:1882128-Pyramimonas_sp.AAC.1